MINFGFLLNLSLLLSIVITQLIIWTIDGTIIKIFINLLNFRKMYTGFDRNGPYSYDDLVKSMENDMNINIWQKSTREK